MRTVGHVETASTRVAIGLAFGLLLQPLALPAAAGLRQQEQSLKGAQLKGRAPINKEVLKVNLPRAEQAALRNGLRLIVLSDNRVQTFTMEMVILSGGLSDPGGLPGLAQFTASQLQEGTASRTSEEIARQMDALGATLSAGAELASLTTEITTSGLVENLDQVLAVFADVVRNPKFPSAEFEKYKTRRMSQLKLLRTNPSFLAQERLRAAIYGDHPVGLLAPPAVSIDKATSGDLREFHKTHYVPGNAILAVAGDVTMKSLKPKIERAFGDWNGSGPPQPKMPPAPERSKTKIHLIDRPGSVQTSLVLGDLAITRDDPDYFPLLVMNRVLGGGPAARLFLNLREDKGYTYGAFSSFGSSKYRGIWSASSSVRTEVTGASMREFMYELRRIRDERVAPLELENAKRALIGSFALSLERSSTQLRNLIAQKVYGLADGYWHSYPEKVSEVTDVAVQQVARKYIDLDRLQIVAVGDAGRIQGDLVKYGSVDVYDTSGTPVKSAADK